MKRFNLITLIMMAMMLVFNLGCVPVDPDGPEGPWPPSNVSGTYIDCVHGCPDLIDCYNCCNETFSSILGACDGKRDQCEALCPPGDMDCLDACVMTRNDCLMQDMRDFDCPHWKNPYSYW